MTLLLDTSVLIDVLRGRKERRALLAELVRQGHTLTTTAINVAEVHAGMRPNEREATEAFLSQLRCFAMTSDVGRIAGSLKGQYARQGVTVELPDMLVAAAALHHNLELMTDNVKDFPMPELKLYSLPKVDKPAR